MSVKAVITMTVPEQADVVVASASAIMRHPSFLKGIEDYRARKRPDFECPDWEYEYRRQFAAAGPRNLKIFTPSGRVTRQALAIFKRNIP